MDLSIAKRKREREVGDSGNWEMRQAMEIREEKQER
jgi:hypothetical protein